MPSNRTYDAHAIELPARASNMTLDALRGSAQAHGFDLANAARLHSSFDWMRDMVWLQSECRALGLSDDQRDVLVDRLRARNEETWGAYSKTDGWSVFGRT